MQASKFCRLTHLRTGGTMTPTPPAGPVLENTTSEAVASPTESGLLSCPNSGAGRGVSTAKLAGFGRGGPSRKDGRTASDVFSTPCPPDALENAEGGFSTPEGA